MGASYPGRTTVLTLGLQYSFNRALDPARDSFVQFLAASKIKQREQGERRKEKIPACKLGPSITVKIGLLPQSILTGCKVHRTKALLTPPATCCVLNRERTLPAVLSLTLWIPKIPLEENHCLFPVCTLPTLPSPKQAIAWRNGDFLPGSFGLF